MSKTDFPSFQAFIRPIKWGKAKKPTEFVPQIDLSITGGILKLEQFDFDETKDLEAAIDPH
ncbi:hypothetical protein ACPD8N_06915 [Lacticaseibacillus chiayiensis]|uniref:hypothetical protein n=1 Tax=Lacticaseibacillus chiayiensis TaxID=2100821 RepID=UPI003C723765